MDCTTTVRAARSYVDPLSPTWHQPRRTAMTSQIDGGGVEPQASTTNPPDGQEDRLCWHHDDPCGLAERHHGLHRPRERRLGRVDDTTAVMVDITAWGWALLILGTIVLLSGFGVMSGNPGSNRGRDRRQHQPAGQLLLRSRVPVLGADGDHDRCLGDLGVDRSRWRDEGALINPDGRPGPRSGSGRPSRWCEPHTQVYPCRPSPPARHSTPT